MFYINIALTYAVTSSMVHFSKLVNYINIALEYTLSSTAKKIQMSTQSYGILSNHGGFVIQPRDGLVDMKV